MQRNEGSKRWRNETVVILSTEFVLISTVVTVDGTSATQMFLLALNEKGTALAGLGLELWG